MSNRIIQVDSEGVIKSVEARAIIIERFESDGSTSLITIKREDWNKYFYIVSIDITPILRYNKDGDIIRPGDRIFIRYIDMPNKAEPEIRKDTRRETLEKMSPDNLAQGIMSSRIDNYAAINPYSFKIGTSNLIIPPSSIQVDKINTSEKVPAIRSRGSIKKNAGRSDTRIVIKMFFNGLEQINDEDNGLRAIIAQFRKTPFVPVINNYLNSVHGIDAVCLHDLTISSMPQFPNTLIATITLFHFEYSIYIPHAFTLGINEKLFKWHYKRNLISSSNPVLKPISKNRTSKLKMKYVPQEYLEEVQKKKVMANESNFQKARADAGNQMAYAKRDAEMIVEIKDRVLEILQTQTRRTLIDDNREYTILINPFESDVLSIEAFSLMSDIDPSNVDAIAVIYLNHEMNKGLGTTTLELDAKKRSATYFLIVEGEWEKLSQQSINAINRNLKIMENEFDRVAAAASDIDHPEERLVDKMKYWPLLDNVIISDIQLSQNNTFSRMPIGAHESAAYQFLGSEDCFIKVDLEVMTDEAAQSLRGLFQYANKQAREFKYDMVSGFLALENEISELFGVRHVLIDSMSFSTVPNFPGRHFVEMVLVNFDVLQSYRERSKVILKDRYDYVIKDQRELGEDVIYPGYTTENLANKETYKEWSRVHDLMKHVDLYPDLDLPTYEEVEQEMNIKLNNPNGSIYVDPDFYFEAGDSRARELIHLLGEDHEILIEDMFKEQTSILYSHGLTHNKESIVEISEIQPIEGSTNFEQRVINRVSPGDKEQQRYMFNVVKEITEKINSSDISRGNRVPLDAALTLGFVCSNLTHVTPSGNTRSSQSRVINRSYLVDDSAEYIPGQKFENPIGLWGLFQVPTDLYGSNTSHSYGYSNLSHVTIGNRLHRPNEAYTSQDIQNDAFVNAEVGIKRLLHMYKEINSDSEMKRNYYRLINANPNLQVICKNTGDRLNEIMDPVWVAAILRYMGVIPEEDKVPQGLATAIMEQAVASSYVYRETLDDNKEFPVDMLLVMYTGLSDEYQEIVKRAHSATLEEGDETVIADLSMLDERPPFSPVSPREYSWYDTIKYCKKGLMVRAFPTFHLFAIDEGRWIGWAKLWDNFYGMNSISEIVVNKSRKRVADTCSITMSNMYKRIDSGQEGVIRGQDFRVNWREALFGGLTREMEESRNFVHGSFIMSAGCRIQVQVGYGNNLKEMPILFNGTITELEIGDYVHMLAQGDGIELTNQLNYSDDHTFGHLGFGVEPQNVFNRLLTYGDASTAWERIKQTVGQRLWGSKESDHPVVHFGLPNFNLFWKSAGELGQNIYPGNGSGIPEWQNAWSWLTEDERNIDLLVGKKSIWDIAQVLTAAIPNYIVAVHPFEFRSTLFYGKPYWDIAFGYEISAEEKPVREGWKKYGTYYIREKKKPYSQWHIYNSLEDIIDNKIKATSEGMFTNVVATYLFDSTQGADSPSEGKRLARADRDIYPQHQTTTILNSELYSKAPGRIFMKLFSNTPIVGTTMNWLLGGVNYLLAKFTTTDNIAFNIAASNVKMYMQDMYSGNLTILGDPCVKPHDYMYIGDFNNEMFGTAGVKEVTHRISVETGFVTSIKPDCAASNEDENQISLWATMGAIAGGALATVAAKAAVGAITAAGFWTITGTVGYGIAAIVSLPMLILVPAFVIVFRATQELLARKFNESQCVTLNLLSYRGRELSAGINGHRGITVGTTLGSRGWGDKIRSMFPSYMTRDIKELGPDAIFGSFHQNYQDEDQRRMYYAQKYGLESINHERLTQEEVNEVRKIIHTGNQMAIFASMFAGTEYSDEDNGFLGISNLGLVKECLGQADFYSNYSSIDQMFQDENRLHRVGGNFPDYLQDPGKIPVNIIRPGDLIFFDLDGDSIADYVGIVTNSLDKRFISSRRSSTAQGRVEINEWGKNPFRKILGFKRPLRTNE